VAGLHLTQLHEACLDLETTLNTALQAAGLTPFTDAYSDPPSGTPTCPYLVVTLGGWRKREAAGIGQATQDTVVVSFRLETDAGEPDALGYEGVVAAVLRDAQPTLNAAVADAELTGWRLEWGSAGIDSERSGTNPWSTTVKVRARLEW